MHEAAHGVVRLLVPNAHEEAFVEHDDLGALADLCVRRGGWWVVGGDEWGMDGCDQ